MPLAKFHRIARYPAEISCRLKILGPLGPESFERRTAVSKNKKAE